MMKTRFGRIEDKFFTLIPKALAFRPIDDIKDFVYSYVLDEKEVSIDILSENVRTYQELGKTLDSVKRRIAKLEIIAGHLAGANGDRKNLLASVRVSRDQVNKLLEVKDVDACIGEYGKILEDLETQEDIAVVKLLAKLRGRCNTPVCQSLIAYLDERLKNGKSVKGFIDLSRLSETELLITGIAQIEQNDRICYIREFSIEHFYDSKIFEAMSGKIAKAMRMFGEEYGGKELEEILAEYGIFHMPNYVYFKGGVLLGIENNEYDIGELRQGMGISGEDVER